MYRLRIIFLACLFSPSLWAQETNLCTNTEKGRPVFIGSKMICSIRQNIDQENSPDLAQKTFGFVKSIELNADLNLVARPAQNIGALDYTIEFSQIEAKGKLTMAGQGNPLDIRMFFAPKIELAGSSVCNLELDSINLGVTRLEVNLPSWVSTALKNYLNKNLLLQKSLSESILESLSSIQKSSCNSQPAVPLNEQIVTDHRWDQIMAKRDLYLDLVSDKVDEKGWIFDTRCDGLLYNSLYNLGGGNADIGAVEWPDQPGKLDRHWRHDCYNPQPNAQGKYSNSSTISRDMMNGFTLFSLLKGDPELVKRVVEYGEQRAFEGFPLIWIVGDGDVGRVDMPPATVNKLYKVREKLTGIPSPYPDFNGQAFGDCKGYECHLEVLSILFDYKANGYITQSAQDYLRALADRLPENALFNIAFGKIAKSMAHTNRGVNTLLNEKYFPSDRLPNNRDRCDEYIFSREMFKSDGQYTHDWLPCPEREFKEFAGVDYLFATAVLLDF